MQIQHSSSLKMSSYIIQILDLACNLQFANIPQDKNKRNVTDNYYYYYNNNVDNVYCLEALEKIILFLGDYFICLIILSVNIKNNPTSCASSQVIQCNYLTKLPIWFIQYVFSFFLGIDFQQELNGIFALICFL